MPILQFSAGTDSLCACFFAKSCKCCKSKLHLKVVKKFPQIFPLIHSLYFFNICITHHADFESVKEIKGQSSNQVDDKPGGHVMDADLPCIEDHLPRLTHVRGAETEHDV